MSGLTVEEKQIALTYAAGGADFMFIPSSGLCELIARGSPETMAINQILIKILLYREPIRLDTNTVIRYCKGTLDNRNTWLFNHGDIKVVPHQYKKPELIKPKEK
jgi:hypothetical protein